MKSPLFGPPRATLSGMNFTRISLFPLLAGLCIFAAPLAAQRPTPAKPTVPASSRKFQLPPGFAPPSGMCRVWIDNVPASQQPAPTDCASAVKNRPLNSRVIFADDKAKGTNRDGLKREED
jgi:hypothetical protein